MVEATWHWRKHSRNSSHVQNSLHATATYQNFYTMWNNSPEARRTVKLLLDDLQEEEAITQAFNQNNPPSQQPSAEGSAVRLYRSKLSSKSISVLLSTILISSCSVRTYGRPQPYPNQRGGPQISRGGLQASRGGFQTSREVFQTSKGNYQGLKGCFRGGFRRFRGNNQHPGESCSYCGLGPHKVTNCRIKKRYEARQEVSPSNANFSQIDQAQPAQPTQPLLEPEVEKFSTGYTSSESIDFETFEFVADSGSS